MTGLRRGELLALRWSDVDLERLELRVRQQLAVEGNSPVLKQLKTFASERVLAIGPATAAMLVSHRDAQAQERSFAGSAWNDSDLVFTTALGGWIDPNNFGRLMDGLVARAGVPRITPKGLRHTAQSVGRVVVGDDKVMQELLGPCRRRDHAEHLHAYGDRAAPPRRLRDRRGVPRVVRRGASRPAGSVPCALFRAE